VIIVESPGEKSPGKINIGESNIMTDVPVQLIVAAFQDEKMAE
jgi:hypothetical protein